MNLNTYLSGTLEEKKNYTRLNRRFMPFPVLTKKLGGLSSVSSESTLVKPFGLSGQSHIFGEKRSLENILDPVVIQVTGTRQENKSVMIMPHSSNLPNDNSVNF